MILVILYIHQYINLLKPLPCLQCPPGTYNENTGKTNCIKCPKGKSCSNLAAAPKDCAKGTFSVEGQIYCQQCPQGSYSLTGADSCTVCPAGKKCFDGSSYTSPTDCTAGTYSPTGSLVCLGCSPVSFTLLRIFLKSQFV